MPLGDLTRPETCAERAKLRRLRAKVVQAGGCPFCVHRGAEGWGRAVCSREGRAFPLCLHDKASPAFEPDEDRLTEAGR